MSDARMKAAEIADTTRAGVASIDALLRAVQVMEPGELKHVLRSELRYLRRKLDDSNKLAGDLDIKLMVPQADPARGNSRPDLVRVMEVRHGRKK